MMFSRFLKACTEIMQTIDEGVASDMQTMAQGIDEAIEKYAIVKHPEFGDIYAFEVDGFGSHNFMVCYSTPHS
jgi:meiotically up-regulated gene 157 (Mug157) protein